MNISNWPMDKIMQLPEECFGQKWPIISTRLLAANTRDEWLMKGALPNKCILWGISMGILTGPDSSSWFKLSLGDHEPTSDAEFDAFERVFPGDFDNIAEPGAFYFSRFQSPSLTLKQPLSPQGRRFVIQAFNVHATSAMNMFVILTISGIPTDIPIQLSEDYWISYMDLVKQIQKTGIGFNP